ncbi:MAG: DUF4230 domain-containing protein [Kineosporiaceae bacterium]
MPLDEVTGQDADPPGGASVGESARPADPSGGAGRSVVPGWAIVVLAVLLALGAVGVALVWAVDRAAGRLDPFAGPVIEERTVDRSGPAVLAALSDVGEYRAAAGYYEVVVDLETEVTPLPSFLAGERVLFVAAGSVDAAVDFAALDEDAVEVDQARRSARIELPPPELGEASLDLDRSYVAGRDRGLFDRVRDAFGDGASGPGEDDSALYLTAERRISEAAGESDELTERARDNTRSMLESLLGSLGFTEVEVVFTDEP